MCTVPFPVDFDQSTKYAWITADSLLLICYYYHICLLEVWSEFFMINCRDEKDLKLGIIIGTFNYYFRAPVSSLELHSRHSINALTAVTDVSSAVWNMWAKATIEKMMFCQRIFPPKNKKKWHLTWIIDFDTMRAAREGEQRERASGWRDGRLMKMITYFHHVRASEQRWSSVCRAAPQAERALPDRARPTKHNTRWPDWRAPPLQLKAG